MRYATLWRALAVPFFGAALFEAGLAQYKQVNLVSDGFLPAVQHDSNLVNPWGMAWGPTGPIWVANNGTGTSTLYNGAGQPFPIASPLIVNVMGADSAPSGLVFNGTSGFPITDGTSTAPARFIFVTESGSIAGWNPAVGGGAMAVPATLADFIVAAEPPVFKGAALADTPAGPVLYATDFKNGRVDAFDGSFAFLGSFTDPNMPADFRPFGIKAMQGHVLVTYAMANAEGKDDVAGPGLGFVDVFTTRGVLVRRLVSHGKLNAPWGMAIAHRIGGQPLPAVEIVDLARPHLRARSPRPRSARRAARAGSHCPCRGTRDSSGTRRPPAASAPDATAPACTSSRRCRWRGRCRRRSSS